MESPVNSLLPGPIERIVVFRALVLGDLLCATPALRALRLACPTAHIALVGLPWAKALVERSTLVDEFIEFPGHPALPEMACDASRLPPFIAAMRERRFDLSLQLHGSGGIVNELVASFGARLNAGFTTAESWRPEADAARFAAWPEQGTEIERLLALTDHLGLPRQGLQLDFPLRAGDAEALREVFDTDGAAYVCVHAGAQLPSRRWSPRRFAEVADGLADRGFRIVLTGGAHEQALTADIMRAMRSPAIDLAGRTSLWTLGALIAGAALVVCNDTGISHVAAALGRPSLVVSSGADVARWAPLDRARHTVFWHAVPCRPCSFAVCPYRHECADAVTPAQLLERAEEWIDHAAIA